jgi:membrane fusion protein, heavy metal efflux system
MNDLTDTTPLTTGGSPTGFPGLPRSRRGLAAGAALVVLIGVLWALVVWWRTGEKEAALPYQVDADSVSIPAGEQRPIRFGTTAAVLEPALPVPPVTARVTTLRALTARSFAPLAGRVADVAVGLGERVKQGSRLVLVRTTELPTLRRDLQAAELSARTKQALVDRTQMLVESRAASTNDLVVAESELEQARLKAQAAESKIRALSVEPVGDNAYWLLASREGTVVQLEAEPGTQVGPDRIDPIATVADLGEVVVVGDLPQRDAAGVRSGLPATVRIPGSTGASLVGTIESVSDVVDPDRQTVPVRVQVRNDRHLLRPNAYVELEISPQSEAPMVQVPAVAVVSDGADSVVFVEERPGVFRRRSVEVGRQTRDRVEIVAGLSAGEPVVVDGALLLLNALDVER